MSLGKNLPLIKNLINALIDLLVFCIGVMLIGVAAYFFGFNILRNPLTGNDAQNVLSYASWLNDYFPKIPLWYPLSGGGISFVLGYPWLYSMSVVLVHRLSELNLFSAMAVLNFASLVLPAVGVFAFVLFRFRLRLAAILAGLFYFLSPISYVLISGAGFLAHAYSYIFAVPLLIFFDCYLTNVLENGRKTPRYIWLFGSGIFFVLTTLAHPVSSLGLMLLFVIYGAILGFFRAKIKGAFKGIVVVILAGVIFYLLSYFWMKPFQDYTAFSNRDLTFTADTSTGPPIKFSGVLGLLGKKPGNEYPFPNLSIVPFVWLMAIVGTVLGLLVYKKKAFALGILVFISTVLIGTYGVWVFFTRINWFMGSFVVNRYYYTSFTILPPILAALGVWYLANLPFALFINFFKSKHWLLRFGFTTISFLVTTTLVVLITFFGLKLLNPISGWYEKEKPWMLHYGEESGISTTSLWNRPYPIEPCIYPPGHVKFNNYCDNELAKKYFDVPMLIRLCEKNPGANANEVICRGGDVTEAGSWIAVSETDITNFQARCKKQNEVEYVYDICLAFNKSGIDQLRNWPRINLPQESKISDLITTAFSDPQHPHHFLSLPNIRIDITPSLGTWNKEWAVANRSGTVNAYTGQLVLNKSFQSFFIDTMYTKDLVKASIAVDEMAKYFGIKAIINTGDDQTEKFTAQSWTSQQLTEVGTLWQPPFETALYSLEQKPLVLVIGSGAKQAYSQVFKAMAMGGTSFDSAILVEGKDNLDDYSVQELSPYRVVILHGYNYKSRMKAISTLNKYVKGGGSVFIDTGWQYVSKDWGNKDSPEKPVILAEPFPVAQTTWGGVGKDWGNAEVNEMFIQNTTVQNFDPLTWEDKEWTVASAQSVRPWAKPLLNKGGAIILAFGELGKGKIVWSGMNLFSHARDSENSDELQFINNIFSFLAGKEAKQSIPVTSFKRIPDKLEIKLAEAVNENTAFYFRESYYPYWSAYAKSNGKNTHLEILSAGPRFMLVSLPELPAGAQVVFEFKQPTGVYLGMLVSAITAVGLLALIFDSLIGGKVIKKVEVWQSKLGDKFKFGVGERIKQVKKPEDEDY